jgi:hypothetical protein
VLKKLMTLMMALSIFTTTAFASTHGGLKTAFDELNYTLTVEWDQKDKDFYTEQMKKFSHSLRELQAQGLTNAQLVEFVKAEVKDERVARDLETAFNMISINKMSAQEANKYMVETMKRSYSTGASWNGSGAVTVAVALLVVVAVIALASAGGSGGGGGYQGCYNYWYCNTYCYYDWWWGYTCYDDCYWTCY